MTLEWWHWEIAGLALVLLELALPSFFIIWFGLGAMLAGLVLLAVPDLALSKQIAAWVIASMAMTVLWFSVARRARFKTLIGTAAGMHPYPAMVRDFQAVIGQETKQQILAAEGRLPDAIVACVGGGSNAIGLFHPFLNDEGVQLFGVESAGEGMGTGRHAAAINGGRPGVLHGNMTYLLQDDEGQITEAHSISAGLDYPGIGPEHSWLHDVGRADRKSVV